MGNQCIYGGNYRPNPAGIAVRNNFEIFTADNDFRQYEKYLPIKLFGGDLQSMIEG
jgi:hypothetical protein